MDEVRLALGFEGELRPSFSLYQGSVEALTEFPLLYAQAQLSFLRWHLLGTRSCLG